MFYEVLNIWCEVGGSIFSVTSRNVFSVSVLYDCIESVNSSVDVCDGSIVQGCEVLFCFIGEFFPVCSFVISVSVSVANWAAACLGGDDDR